MFEFRFADIGEGVSEGKLLKWFFDEGDEIEEGDDLFLVETDKVNAEIPSPVNGKLVKKMANVGDTIEVGDVIAEIDDGNDDKISKDSDKENESDEESAGVVGEIEVSSEVIESSKEVYSDKKAKRKKVLATPVARKLAKDLNIDINTIKGSGPNGRVMKSDIYEVKKQLDEKSKKSDEKGQEQSNSIKIRVPDIKINGEVERVKLTTVRKTIAKNMVISKSVIPHAATIDEIDATKLVKFRKEQKELAEDEGITLTYMPFIIKAITKALKEFPRFNASYDAENEELILKKYYNIGIAVDTPEGLIVPVIKDTNNKSIFDIAQLLHELSEGARKRTLDIDQLQNSTFTITNYGAVGAQNGVPIIKYPEVAILGIGRIEKRPIVINNNKIVIRDILPISLCIDHRVIDGGDAGRLIRRFKELINNPMLLTLS